MNEDPFDKELCSLVERLLEKYHVPGLSVAIVDNGKTYAKGFGLARFPSTEAKPETLYFTGSTTKAMLATVLGFAIHDSKRSEFKSPDGKPLSWKTPIRDVLGDDFAVNDVCTTNSASIEDALSHRSGMPGHDSLYGPWLGPSPRELTKRMRYLGPPTQPFRTAFQYNNMMYAVAGDVLETLTGKTCGDVLRAWLWEPLGMKHTFWHLQDAIADPNTNIEQVMSRGYYWYPEEKSQASSHHGYYIPDPFISFAGIAPAGATLSSVSDYTKWMQALLEAASEGSFDTVGDPVPRPETPVPFLQSALFRDLTTPRIFDSADLPGNTHMMPHTYSLGWLIPSTVLGVFHPLMAHAGGLTGYGTELFLLPNDNFGIVTMGNTGATSNIVGALLAQEVLAKRMGLKDNGIVVKHAEMKQLEDFMKMRIAGMRDEETEPDSAGSITQSEKVDDQVSSQLKLEGFISSDAGNMSEKLKRYEGLYENIAYGQFRVTFCSASGADNAGARKLHTDRIHYRFRKNSDEKNLIRSSTHSLKITALGKRTWASSWLLHPRKSKSTDQTQSAGEKNQEFPIFFDQEYLSLHGNIEDDVVPGVPTGCEGGGDARCRRGMAWQSTAWTEFGAAIMQSATRGSNMQLGMTMANELMVKAGSNDVGWEQNMIWFDKASE